MTDLVERVDVAIVGGGITGLCAAYRLLTRAPGLTCLLLEAADRLGGKVLTESIETEHGQFIVEAGPDAFLAQKPWARQLVEELGLADRIIPVTTVPHPVGVLKRGRPIPLPDGVSLLAPTRLRPFLRSPLLSPAGKARLGLDLVLPARTGDDDESLAEFVQRRLGPEALDWIAEPLMAGIYSAEPERLSLLATFPNYRGIERDHQSLIRGLRAIEKLKQGKVREPAFLSLRGGMQELTDALATRVAGIARCGAGVESVGRTTDGTYALRIADRLPIVARTVLITVAAVDAARLIEPIAPQVARDLAQLRTVGAGSVSLAYRADEVRRPLAGYGLVVPRRERRPINAITLASRKFRGRAPEGWQLLRVFFGGARSPASMLMDDDHLIRVVREQLGELLGIEAPPSFHRVYRWSAGSPQYDVGHLDRIAKIEQGLPPGLIVTGSAYHGVGLPDLVRSATTATDRIIAEAGRQPSPPDATASSGIPVPGPTAGRRQELGLLAGANTDE